MREELQAVLELQPAWVARGPSDEMALRGFYIRGDIADFVRAQRSVLADRLLCAVEDLEIEGKDSTGYYSRVPWVRFADRTLSENPREGWYAVYLFAESGAEASLSLNQGTQTWDGIGMRSRPEDSIRVRSEWARAQIADATATRPRLSPTIDLGSAEKSRSYEAGNVVAYRYPSGEIPDDDALVEDLLDIADLLRALYRAEAAQPVPGDRAPEIVEAERLAQDLAGRRVPRRSGFRANAKQRRAIELQAMRLATEHFERLGASVKDVSANHSYDLEIDLHGTVTTVEVKGTVSDGSEVLITRSEVSHHETAHPSNALVVVSRIELRGPPDAPEAIAGELHVLKPWKLAPERLTPIAYRYLVHAEAGDDRSQRGG
jgi:MrcB-like, N-terminal domain/Domain of unknown function (DUF3883)